MSDKDALGDLVKEWREKSDEPYLFPLISRAFGDCADQLDKVRKGKILVDKWDMEDKAEKIN